MADIFSLFKQIEKKNDTPTSPITHLIVGLGNPGDKYFHTRHNAGFLMMDYLSQRCSVQVNKIKFKALVGEATIAGKRCLLMKPQTFMNLSGEAVQQAAAFYKIPMQNVLVLSDDISLDVGRLRVRGKGSDGGQKGLRSIITLMNSDDFPRIRFGVGKKPHPDFDLADWVLSEFTKDEQPALFAAFEKAYDGVLKVLEGDVDGAMQICNGK
jgi:PTH1 family peptidyl-tRNA hydrolase